MDQRLIWLAFVSLGVSQLSLLIYLFKKEAKQEKVVERQPEVEEKSWNIIRSAIKKAQAIIGQAEIEGNKIAAESKFFSGELDQKYEAELASVVSESESAITEATNKTTTTVTAEMTTALEQFKSYLEGLERKSSEMSTSLENATRTQMEKVLSNFHNELGTTLMRLSEKATGSVEGEIQATLSEIKDYKKRQMEMVDERIVEIAQKAIEEVIKKKIDVGSEMELVYEALEKAKKEQFF